MSQRVKVLVVGQTPPPHHGQAIMIERLLQARFARVELHHVRMAFSESIDDVGRFRLGKLFHLLGVIVRIIYCRLRHGAEVLYYPPAGPNRVPLYRDLAILLCTRWLFRRTVFHFHATGVSQLYPRLTRVVRFFVRRVLFHPDAVIAIARCGLDDVRFLCAKREYLAPNGIEDKYDRLQTSRSSPQPVPQTVASQGAIVDRPLGSASGAMGQMAIALLESPPPAGHTMAPLRVLFVGILRESKGLLVLLDACGRLAARGVPFRLEVMGQFQSPQFAAAVKQRIDELAIAPHVNFLGVLSGEAKWEAFARCDVLCLPTHYESETFPTVLLEAMSLARPVIATRWRGIPEIVDDGATGYLVETQDAAAVARRLEQMFADPALRRRLGEAGRQKFLREFTIERFLQRMEEVFLETAQS